MTKPRMWSYWTLEDVHDRRQVWQVVPAPKDLKLVKNTKWEKHDIVLKLTHVFDPGPRYDSNGSETLVGDLYHYWSDSFYHDQIKWRPILKDDIPLWALGGMP